MTRLVHLTDLHFGCEREELVAPLGDAVRASRAEFLVVTGDLTHRGRPEQFRRAMAFLTATGLPYVAMPGNHDVPLYNLFLRLQAPFRNWRRGVSAATGGTRDTGSVRVHAVNTADPYRWRRGRLREDELKRVMGALGPATQKGWVNVLACHHPMEEPPGYQRGETKGAFAALPLLAERGLHVVLSGHLHHWEIGLGVSVKTPRPVLLVQTGTALCARPGESEHGYSVLDIEANRVAVTPWMVNEATASFAPRTARVFERSEGGWRPAPQGMHPGRARSVTV